jgi:hypothetical protein
VGFRAHRLTQDFLAWVHKRNAEITAVSAALTVVVTAAGFGLAIEQLRSSDASEQERIAQDTFREFLKLASQEPRFADGQRKCTAPCDGSDSDKYEWFVSYFLHSAEQIVNVHLLDRVTRHGA